MSASAAEPAVPDRPVRFPAEWEPHAATWLAWPHNTETWPGCLEQAEQEFGILVESILEFEPVRVLVQGEAHRRHVRSRLGASACSRDLAIHVVPTDDAWLRDTGPTFVLDRAGALVAIDWIFNAWGGKYPPWQRDGAVARAVAGIVGAGVETPGLCTEGGALETDGDGTLLATEGTIVDEARNPGLGRKGVERILGRSLGAERFVWLPSGIEGDDTDGHVDDVARFVGPGRVVCARETNRRDPNHESLEACRGVLHAARDAAGRPLEVVDLPMPSPIDADGDRLPASYANFALVNGGVIVPVFGDAADETALSCLSTLFPARRVVPVPARTLVRGLGGVHCLTQQEPARPVSNGA